MYYNEDVETVLKKLDSSESGLLLKEVDNRLKKDGKNILPHKNRPSWFELYLKEFQSPIELILVFTVIVSFAVGEIVDAFVILFIILVDTIMGAFQENKALKSVESLNNMIKSKSKVLRDGKEYLIDSELIVVGDILLLESGDRINADARIVESTNLQVDESVLTGESLHVQKNNQVLSDNTILAERKNMLYAGCSVITGRALAVVVSTGIQTEIGKIFTQVVDTEEEKTPLTIRMEKFSKQISIIIILVSIVSAIILYVNGQNPSSIFLSVVALAISAMPEGLPLALTMALTIASNKMSKKNVIVKNLSSVEALGSCTVIASDKTGTLTVNEQTARKIVLKNGETIEVTGIGYNDNGKVLIKDERFKDEVTQIIHLCAFNNEATFEKKGNQFEYFGDSIDIAFLALKEKYGTSFSYVQEKMISYESEKQYSAVFYKDNGRLKCCVKGSLEKVMSFSEKKQEYVSQNEKLSEEGYRVIAVCDGFVDGMDERDIKNLDFLGMVAFIDPVRKEVKKSIKECQQAGIKVIMITGDHPTTAFTIAKDLNLAVDKDEVITGMKLDEIYAKGEEYFDECIKHKKVFSRVTPTDKLRIVKSLKRTGEFVAVTGDGVNDAPAIKSANIGVAMGSGTDVAIDTADLIILDDDFTSLVEGIKEGRVAYSNIRKIVLFLLSCGIAEILFYLFAVCFGYELPLVAIQLLWINIVTDGLQDMALSFEKESSDIMKERPRSTKESLFNRDLMIEVGVYGFTISFMIFFVWKYLMDHQTNIFFARSIIMLIMVGIQNFHVLNCRSEKNSVFATSLMSNPLILYTIIGSILLQFLVIFIPVFSKFLKITILPIDTILASLVFSLVIIVVAELYKFVYRMVKQ
ncbi:MAG: cation-transporting P-type ATPase [Bacilli bacterium]|nr:cation-transporting P-type ATPase [Bacilli bacterium]